LSYAGTDTITIISDIGAAVNRVS